jgi:hypothetical protein
MIFFRYNICRKLFHCIAALSSEAVIKICMGIWIMYTCKVEIKIKTEVNN